MAKKKGDLGIEKTETQDYKERCFVAWYSAGKPSTYEKQIETMPEDDLGQKPKEHAIRKWIEQDWQLRADELDARSIEGVEIQLIEQRKEILSRQASEGKLLQEKGMKFLQTGEFKNAGEAIRAVIMGAALESKASGIDLYMDIMGKSNKELQQYIKEEQTKSKGNEIEALDGDFVDAAEEVDATSTDEGSN